MHEKRGEKFAVSTSMQSEFADFDWAVRFHRVLLKASGIWPVIYESQWKRFLINFYSLISPLMLLLFALLPSVNGLFLVRHNMVAVIDNLQFTVPLTGALVKYLDVWARKRAVAAVVQVMSNDWAKPRSTQEQETMISQAQLCHTVFRVTGILMTISAILFVGAPLKGVKLRQNTNLTREERPFIIQSQFFFDVNVSPTYELVFFAQAYGICFAGLSYTAVDNFLVFLILHIRGQLKILRSRILAMSRSKTFQSDLIANVHDQIGLSRTIGIVDSIFAIAFCGVLLYFAIIFCLYTLLILYLVQQDGNIAFSRLFFVVMVLATTFSHTALSCIMGEILVIELDEVYNAVCASDWESLKRDDARKLILVMLYSSKPIYLTAGKIVPMNMTTFCKMLQMSASYVSFLLAKLQ